MIDPLASDNNSPEPTSLLTQNQTIPPRARAENDAVVDATVSRALFPEDELDIPTRTHSFFSHPTASPLSSVEANISRLDSSSSSIG